MERQSLLLFSQLLTRSGLRKVYLASALGRTKSTVSRWSDERVPAYVLEYLKLWIEVQRYRP
jgi:hypothetical protein